MLVGLAAKNAILIVEFARQLEAEGKAIGAGGREGCTAPAPADPDDVASRSSWASCRWSLASGAGAEMRHTLGIAVFCGMLGVTLFGLFLTPVFYVVVRRLAGAKKLHDESVPAQPVAA